MAGYAIHGHAIVSDDDKIADAQSRMPEVLRNEADWQRFQDALDRAAAILLGRKGHFAHPDRHRRNRIVVSSAARGIERRADAWWWNPNEVPLAVALAEAAPRGGIIAVPGGQRVYDAFLKSGGFDEFHLVRAHGVTLGDGVFLFGDCAAGRTAEEVLTAHGHAPMPEQVLDRQARVVLTVWRGRSAVARAAV